MNVDTTPFEFTYTHPVELPCGDSFEIEYLVTAEAVPQYTPNDFTGIDEYYGMSFDILSVEREAGSSIMIHSRCEDMRKFRAALEEKARDIYEQRSGPTDFAEVVVHDRVDTVAVRVVETIQLTSKAA